MYRTAELRKYQYYINPDWSGKSFRPPSKIIKIESIHQVVCMLAQAYQGHGEISLVFG
jgi:hypothetical protein